jgi:hypothetical protein
MVARTATQRALILGGGVLIAGLIIAGVTLAGGGHRSNGDLYGSRKHPAVAQLAATPTVRPSVPYGRSSLVSSGMSCSRARCEPAPSTPPQFRYVRLRRLTPGALSA